MISKKKIIDFLEELGLFIGETEFYEKKISYSYSSFSRENSQNILMPRQQHLVLN
jgi:hypothetical protein